MSLLSILKARLVRAIKKYGDPEANKLDRRGVPIIQSLREEIRDHGVEPNQVMPESGGQRKGEVKCRML